jgi:protein-disulfide isomerase
LESTLYWAIHDPLWNFEDAHSKYSPVFRKEIFDATSDDPKINNPLLFAIQNKIVLSRKDFRYQSVAKVSDALIVIAKSIQFQEKEIKKAEKKIARFAFVGENIPIIRVNGFDGVLGNRKAPFSIIQYSDYECAYCGKIFPKLQEKFLSLTEKEQQKVNYTLRLFPLSYHPNAWQKANVAMCAKQLSGDEAFWEMSTKLFEDSEKKSSFIDFSALEKYKIQPEVFKNCVDKKLYEDSIKKLVKNISQKISGTPTIFLVNNANGEIISSWYGITEEEIEDLFSLIKENH